MNPHPPQDVPKGILPSDSITKLTFSPVNEHLFAVASMDGSVRQCTL
jgi:hypothetical protein